VPSPAEDKRSFADLLGDEGCDSVSRSNPFSLKGFFLNPVEIAQPEQTMGADIERK
jgi:hypothetical protein